MRTPIVLLVLVAACSGGVTLTDATIPEPPGTPGRTVPGPRDGGPSTAEGGGDSGTAGPDAGFDAGTLAGPDPTPPPPPPAPQLAPIFPASSPWNTRIDGDPVDPNSDAYIADMGADDPLTAAWDAEGDGIPYIEV